MSVERPENLELCLDATGMGMQSLFIEGGGRQLLAHNALLVENERGSLCTGTWRLCILTIAQRKAILDIDRRTRSFVDQLLLSGFWCSRDMG